MTSNALAIAQDKRQPVDNRVAGIRDLMLANKDKIGRGIAGLLTPERAIMVACNSIRKNPRLLDATPQSLFGAIAEAAGYGWTCDGVLGHASLVPFNNTKRNAVEVTLIPGYKGLRDLIRRSGSCDTVLESVHEGDEYEYLGPLEKPRHVRSKSDDRKFKPVTHAYVLGIFPSGVVKCFSWTRGECIAHRDKYSQNWKRSPKLDNPWHPENPAFRVMCMKSVLLDAIHRGEFPLSVDEQRIATREIQPAGDVVLTDPGDAAADDAAEAVLEQSPPARDAATEPNYESCINPSGGIDLEKVAEVLPALKIRESAALASALRSHCLDDGQSESLTKMVESHQDAIRAKRAAG